MKKNKPTLPQTASTAEVQAFLQKVSETPPAVRQATQGRLIFALDATASRQQTWDQACHTQAQMFRSANALNGLLVQLCYYRGFGEFESSDWVSRATELTQLMTGVRWLAGQTQIAQVLRHGLAEAKKSPVQALVFVGDCMEESIDRLGHLAGQLRLYNVKLFLFQEGDDATARDGFRHLARLTEGAHCAFDAGSADQLRSLLGAVARYASGGVEALKQLPAGADPRVRALTHQILGD